MKKIIVEKIYKAPYGNKYYDKDVFYVGDIVCHKLYAASQVKLFVYGVSTSIVRPGVQLISCSYYNSDGQQLSAGIFDGTDLIKIESRIR